MTSPGRTSIFLRPSSWTQPVPDVMTSVWPAGCVCQCDRAPGLNSTWPPVELLYVFAGNTGVPTTWPENVSAEPTVDGREPFAETCIVSAAAEVAITIASGNAALSKRVI